jgi:hypothetical protein
MSNKSIGIIICYFGKFPWYFDYFLHSCQFNPSVDIFIITDITDFDGEMPSNVKFVYLTLEDLNQLVTTKLNLKTNIDFAYKMCDFKPAYGFLFSDILEPYDFWGQSDIDVIFGNIREFITDEILEEFDFISIRHDYTTGCFALYRNNSDVNSLFKKTKDFEKIFTSNIHYCFDECSFAHDLLSEGQSIFEIKTEIESFTHIILSAVNNQTVKAHFDFILLEGLPGRIVFDKGRIVYRGKFEGILYHLYWLKRDYHPKRLTRKIPDKYYISPTKIYFK